ncbi:MAG: hypothetical protein RI909_1154, partial [Bacteroidota bacterium]
MVTTKIHEFVFYIGLISVMFLSCQQKERTNDKLFQELSTDQTGIDFSNTIKENDQFNIIEYLYFYNGGGIAAGDINNDGLTDLYFSSNQ